jgi:hypothetical protein
VLTGDAANFFIEARDEDRGTSLQVMTLRNRKNTSPGKKEKKSRSNSKAAAVDNADDAAGAQEVQDSGIELKYLLRFFKEEADEDRAVLVEDYFKFCNDQDSLQKEVSENDIWGSSRPLAAAGGHI